MNAYGSFISRREGIKALTREVESLNTNRYSV